MGPLPTALVTLLLGVAVSGSGSGSHRVGYGSSHGSSYGHSPSSGYGVPRYTPSSSYGAHRYRPSSGYGAPNYRPSSGYGAPKYRPSSGYGAPKYRPSSSYGAPKYRPYGGSTHGLSGSIGALVRRPSASTGAVPHRPSASIGKPITGGQDSGVQRPVQFPQGDQPDYIISWRDVDPIRQYSWNEADEECRSRGRRLISLQTAEKDAFAVSEIKSADIPYIWTSGTKQDGLFFWGDGSLLPSGYTNWSKTGGAGRPQPDNNEGSENCVGVLNNFYDDGIVWHDIACHHRKHFICE
ncbi:pulmonary surfactant-associated protein D-like [Pollicipes pollicipes]|uniref:pulmonary surfactant-associated protein D-like n=1 Tax=Pollicipes pollicipes TaxID=41117 RepID=UPI0018859EBF|nr:pulmonary surfactant-associated protein D-like [Pollicipes pollicipes]